MEDLRKEAEKLEEERRRKQEIVKEKLAKMRGDSQSPEVGRRGVQEAESNFAKSPIGPPPPGSGRGPPANIYVPLPPPTIHTPPPEVYADVSLMDSHNFENADDETSTPSNRKSLGSLAGSFQKSGENNRSNSTDDDNKMSRVSASYESMTQQSGSLFDQAIAARRSGGPDSSFPTSSSVQMGPPPLPGQPSSSSASTQQLATRDKKTFSLGAQAKVSQQYAPAISPRYANMQEQMGIAPFPGQGAPVRTNRSESENKQPAGRKSAGPPPPPPPPSMMNKGPPPPPQSPSKGKFATMKSSMFQPAAQMFSGSVVSHSVGPKQAVRPPPPPPPR